MDISNVAQFQSFGNTVQLSLLQTASETDSSMSEVLSRIANVSNDTGSGSALSQYLDTYNQLSQLQLMSGSSSSSAGRLLSSLADALSSSGSSSTDAAALAQTLNLTNQLSVLQSLGSTTSADELTTSLANLLNAAQSGSDTGGYLSQYMSTYNKLSLVQLLGDTATGDSSKLMAIIASIADAVTTRSDTSTNISGALLNLYA